MKEARQKFYKIEFAKKVEKIKARRFKSENLKLDKRGFFLIRLRNKKIEVGFCNYNFKITKAIYGENAQDIYKEIIKRKLITKKDHASYLGYELAKAEYALKHKTKYVQS